MTSDGEGPAADRGLDLGGRRLGVVTTSYPREAGDPAGAFVAGFTRWLASQGAAIEVIAAGPGAAFVDGISVRRVDGRGLFYAGGAPDALGRGGGAWLAAAAFQAALCVEVGRRGAAWDGVVSHWVLPSAFAVESAALARGGARRRPPHVAVAHSSDVWLLRRSKVGRAALGLLARRADLVYAGAHLRVAGAPGRVVPMGVDAASLRGDRARGRARILLQRNNLPSDRPFALFLGRLVPIKGLDLLLAALPENLELLVAGDGPLREALERTAPRRVHFLGEVRGEQKADLLAAADLLVFTSRPLPDGRDEGTPTVLLEARAAGLPIVATRTGGVSGVLTDGVDALLVEPEVGALGAALARLAADATLRHKLASAPDRDRHDWCRVGPVLASGLVRGAP